MPPANSVVRWSHWVLGLLLSLAGASAWAQIKVGQPSGFTGPAAAGVRENTDGAKLYLDHINAKGGIYGQRVELISVDDQFKPQRTAELAAELIDQHGVVALFLNRGTPHTQAVLPLLAQKKVPLVAPSTGAMVLHAPVNPWVFNVRASYQREAAKAIEHLTSLGMTRIAVLQTNDSFGEDAVVGAHKGFDKAQIKPVLLSTFERENPAIDPLVEGVKSSQAQAVLVIGSAGNTVNILKALRAKGSRVQVVTLSNNASEGFIQQMGELGRGVIVTQVFPYERSVSSLLIKEINQLAKAKAKAESKDEVPISPALVEGFAAAKVLVEGLRRAGPNPTPSKLRDALEGIQSLDMGGLMLSYSPNDHSGLDFADLSIVDANGRFRR